MRAFFYSAFLFRNGQNAIPSILLPGAEWRECFLLPGAEWRECCGWKSKMADGEMSAADSNTSLPEKTLLLISFYHSKVRGFFQWYFVQQQHCLHSPWFDGCVSSPLYIGMPKHSAYPKQSPYFLLPLYLQGKIAAITAAMAASSSAAIFVSHCLLIPGPHISTGVFLCRQSELFLAFRSNHPYSIIVD